MSEIISAISGCFNENIYKCILSKPISKDCKYKKAVISLHKNTYQIEKFTETQAFHENTDLAGVLKYLLSSLGNDFAQYNAWDGACEYSIKISKKGKVLTSKRSSGQAPKAAAQHNREKNYILKPGTVIPPLVDMGIFTKDGKIVSSMHDKYRQINRFVELIDDEAKKLDSKKTLNILDFGCGKSYLTFVLYYYFTEIAKIPVKMTGLDLKTDVIEKCNKTAEKYGYKNLSFQTGDIGKYDFSGSLDMVITLHACDTATDYALYNAIKWDAKMIFSVPCCQHEINSQMKTDRFAALTRYGIIKERFSSLVTDSIRGNLLEYCGYKTQMIEFVDFEHTPKNILIRAVKGSKNGKTSAKALAEAAALIEEFDLQPTLYKLLEAGKNSH